MTVVEHHSVVELQELFRQEKNARIAKRIWMVWQARTGLTEPQITVGIGLARRTVQTCVQRYNEEGLAGLRDRQGRGRQPILSPEQQQAVAQRLEVGRKREMSARCEVSFFRSSSKTNLASGCRCPQCLTCCTT